MTEHCCAEGAREHGAKAYWRRREEERLIHSAHQKWERRMEEVNRQYRQDKHRREHPEMYVGWRGFARWLFDR